MKIALLAPANSIHTVKWFNNLIVDGHEVHLISAHKLDTNNPPFDINGTIHYLNPLAPLGYAFGFWKLKQLLKTIHPDILNVHYATGYGLLARLSDFHPTLLSVWGSDVYEFPKKSLLHKKLLIANLTYCDSIASTSQCMGQETRLLIPSKPIFITPFSVNIDQFIPKTIDECMIKKTITIGTVKGLKKIYAIDVLIKAFSIAQKKLPDYKLELVIAGQGDQLDELVNLTSELKAENVNFLGFISNDQVPDLLKTFDIFAALSRQESFGVAVIEAAASGLPVVVSDAEGFKEIVKDNVTGLITPIDDSAAAAEAIIHLIENPNIRKTLSTNAREFVLSEFSPLICTQKLVHAMNQTINGSKK